MSDIEQKALALANEVRMERGWDAHTNFSRHNDTTCEALCRAIEQHEAFRQEVSDAVGDTLFMVETHCDGEAVALVSNRLLQFIIPKPKPDPLVEALDAMKDGRAGPTTESYAKCLRAALDALGLEIREKNDDA